MAISACAARTKAPGIERHLTNPARAAALSLGAQGKIDRASRALADLDASDPATRADTEVAEITWLAELSRCKAARAFATHVGLASTPAAIRAVAECDRIETPPSPEAVATMRARFHEAVAVEASDPARAIALYESAWEAAPTGAVMLGLARAARAKGDAALAEKSLERALGWAERNGDRPQLVLGVPRLPESAKHAVHELELISIGRGAALFQLRLTDNEDGVNSRSYVMRDDLKTGRLTVVWPGDALGASEHYALVDREKTTALVDLGVDDTMTARSIPALADASSASFSPNEKLIAATENGHAHRALLVDVATGRLLWSTPRADDLRGFASDDTLVVQPTGRAPCIVSGPEWKTCEELPNLSPADGGVGTVNGGFIVLATGTQLTVYDLPGKQVKARFHGHFSSVTSLPISADGKTLLSRSESRMIRWNVATGAHERAALNFYDSDAAFSRDGAYLVDWGINTGQVDVYDATQLPALVTVSSSTVGNDWPGITFVVDGRLLLGAGATAVLDVGTGAFTHYDCAPYRRAEMTSRLLACGDDVFDLATGARVATRAAQGATPTRTLAGEAVATKDLDYLFQGVDGVRGDSTTVTTPDKTKTFVAAPGGTFRVVDEATHATSTLVIGRDATLETAADGSARITGNEASVACRVGDVWLPLDACRDRLLRAR